MATTTNYSWTTPDDTDLVKDGASAIRTLGSAIDTTVFTNAGAAVAKSTIDAKGDLLVGTADNTIDRLAVGTDGYTLVADSSVSPQGLKWAVDPVADVITTAGDLIYGTAADTVARLGIGTAGQVLQVNSGATAPEWAAPSAGAYTSLATGSLSGGSVSLTSISGSYKDLILILDGAYTSAGGGRDIAITVNGDTSSIYGHTKTNLAGAVSSANAAANIRTGNDSIGGSSSAKSPGYYVFHNYASASSRKTIAWWNGRDSSTGYMGLGFIELDAAITSITGTLNADTFSGGTYILYGVK